MLVQKSIENHFTNGFIANHFKDVLSLAGPFVGKVDSVSTIDDIVNINFLVGLTDNELNELDIFISHYMPDQYYNITGHPTLNIYGSSGDKGQFDHWQTIKTFIFPGIAKTGYPEKLSLIASIDPGVLHGFVRIYSLCCRGVVACTKTITTFEPTIFDLGKGRHWPITPGVMEIQVKRETATNQSSKYIYFNELKIEFNAGSPA